MTEREEWRERMRARIAAKAATVEQPSAAMDAETRAIIEDAKARRKEPKSAKSYDDPSSWQGRGYKAAEQRKQLTQEEWKTRQADGIRRHHAQRREALIAAGERACNVCGETKPLSSFRMRSTGEGRETWYPYCRPCESELSNTRWKRAHGRDEA